MKRLIYPTRRIVRDPTNGQALPAAGTSVEWNTYWQRRLREGDVSLTDPRKSEVPAADAVPAPTRRKTKE